MPGFRTIVAALMLLPALAWANLNDELYSPYQELLSRYLVEQALPGGGLVSAYDYPAALNDADVAGILDRQRQALAAFDPDRLTGQAESVAFWINAYNFFMLDQILSEQPKGELVTSVWDYGGRVNPFVDNVFERETFVVGGESYSLDGIEKGLLLGDAYRQRGWKDARVHFAVNCASVGCPPLRKQVYTADNLEPLLAENTRRALATARHLTVEDGQLYLSDLFKWYRQDFEQASGSLRGFVLDWADDRVARAVAETDDLEFQGYDWALNRPENFPELQ